MNKSNAAAPELPWWCFAKRFSLKKLTLCLRLVSSFSISQQSCVIVRPSSTTICEFTILIVPLHVFEKSHDDFTPKEK